MGDFGTFSRSEVSRNKHPQQWRCGDVPMTLRGKVDARRTSSCPRFYGNFIPPEKANARGCVFTNLPFLFYSQFEGGGNKCTTCDPIRLFIPPPLRTGVNPSTHATIPHGHPDINNSPYRQIRTNLLDCKKFSITLIICLKL